MVQTSFDPNSAETINCTTKLPTTNYYELQNVGETSRIIMRTEAQINAGSFNNTPGSGTTYSFGDSAVNANNRCFDESLTYKAFLQSRGGTWSSPNHSLPGFDSIAGWAGYKEYSGQFLNFAYSSQDGVSDSNPNAATLGNGSITAAAENYNHILPDGNYIARSQADKGSRTQKYSLFDAYVLRMTQLIAATGELGTDRQAGLVTFDFDDSAKITGADKSQALVRFPMLGENENPTHDVSWFPNTIQGIFNDWRAYGAYGNTPLARSVAQTARYYLQGESNTEALDISKASTSALNANDVNGTKVGTDITKIMPLDLFGEEPAYFQTTYKPTSSKMIPNKNGKPQTCMKNNIVVLTDGLSEKDIDGNLSPDALASEVLGKWGDSSWDDGTGNGRDDFDDVVQALNAIDLLPEYEDFHNNIVTHIFGYGINSADDAYFKNAVDNTPGLYVGTDGIYDDIAEDVWDAFLAAIGATIKGQGTAFEGSAAKPVFSTDTLEATTQMFQSRFYTGDWHGTLRAYDLWYGDSNKVDGEVKYPEVWEAGNVLPEHGDRNIFTSGLSAEKAVEFVVGNYDKLTPTQQADLIAATGSGTNGINTINYLRGDGSLEGGSSSNFRMRNRSKLGDIIHSSPAYVGAPDMKYTDAQYPGYSTYKGLSRTPMVYVGANDGMLHAFNASTGIEEWAYMPQGVFASSNIEGMSALLSQDYNESGHRYSVDGTPVVVDVYMDPPSVAGTDKEWRTILIGTMRAGARGLFALDITDPDLPDNPTDADYEKLLLWDLSGDALTGNFTDIGFIHGDPSVVKLPSGDWGVVFGNGYNSANNDAALYILNVKTGALIKKIVVNDVSEFSANGLAEVRAVDVLNASGAEGSDGAADRIYAGDLQGQMWVFHYSSGVWSSVHGNTPLIATGQPITTAPVLMPNPNSNSAPNLIVLFNAGKLLETDDLTTVGVVSSYGVYDKGAAVSKSDLLTRSMTTTLTTVGTKTIGSRALGVTSEDVASNGNKGWYFDLDAGERVITNPRLYRGVFFYSTMTPSDGACDLGGDSWLMTVDPVEGLAPDFDVIDTNGDGTRNGDDIGDIAAFLGGVTTTPAILGDRMYVPGTAARGNAKEFDLGSPASGNTDRLTWEELFRN